MSSFKLGKKSLHPQQKLSTTGKRMCETVQTPPLQLTNWDLNTLLIFG